MPRRLNFSALHTIVIFGGLILKDFAMEKAIEKAKALIEAMEYIRKFNGKLVVDKLGGSVLDDPELQKKMLTDVVFMATVGIQPIIVHGGGKAITRAMSEAGLEPVWVHGRRYTDERTLNIAEQVLCGRINKRIVDTLKELDVDAIGLNSLSSCVLIAERKFLLGEDQRRIDVGYVGNVASGTFDGPPQEVLDQLGLEQTVTD